MHSHEASCKFLDHIGIDKNSYLRGDAEKMIRYEAEAEIERGSFYKQKNQYSKAVDVALARMIAWYDEGLEYHFDEAHDFVASHRISCTWTVLLKRYHSRLAAELVNLSTPDL